MLEGQAGFDYVYFVLGRLPSVQRLVVNVRWEELLCHADIRYDSKGSGAC
jgi:hypothetical protein